jgi:hypothetical protein
VVCILSLGSDESTCTPFARSLSALLLGSVDAVLCGLSPCYTSRLAVLGGHCSPGTWTSCLNGNLYIILIFCLLLKPTLPTFRAVQHQCAGCWSPFLSLVPSVSLSKPPAQPRTAFWLRAPPANPINLASFEFSGTSTSAQNYPVFLLQKVFLNGRPSPPLL